MILKRIAATLIIFVLLLPTVYSSSASSNYVTVSLNAPFAGEYLVSTNLSTDTSAYESSGTLQNLNAPSDSTDTMGAPANMSVKSTAVVDGGPLYECEPKLKRNYAAHPLASPSYSLSRSSYSEDTSKSLKVYNFYTEKEYNIQVKLLYSGEHCTVWGDVVSPEFTKAYATQIATEFDANVYSLMTTNFGNWNDADNDGKLAIICYDIKDPYYYHNYIPYYIGGYFYENDMLPLADGGNGNKMDMINIDLHPSMGKRGEEVDATSAYGTIVHEMQHLINYSDYFFNSTKQATGMSDWLNEAFSEAAAYMYDPASEQDRIQYYNSDPEGLIRDGQSAYLWKQNLESYSLSFLFSQYLRIQTEGNVLGGNNVFKAVISSNQYDYRAVEEVLRKIDAKLEFKTFYQNFRIALVAKADKGYYGFHGEADFERLNTLLNFESSVSLTGGGSIVRMLSSPVPQLINKGKDVSLAGISFSAGNYVENITLNLTESTIDAGFTESLSATIAPLDATNQEIRWSSSDNKIALVDNNGKVTGLSAGSVKITATAADASGSTVSAVITVVGPPPIISSAYTITDNIIKISPKTTVRTLKSSLSVATGTIVINTKNNVEAQNDVYACTFMTALLQINNTVVSTYTIIVSGDLNGDGVVNAMDLLLLKKHLLSKQLLINHSYTAADIISDSSVNALDYLAMKNYLLGKISL